MKSHADDLNVKAGTVRSRVALLLRSAEVYPDFSRFDYYIAILCDSYCYFMLISMDHVIKLLINYYYIFIFFRVDCTILMCYQAFFFSYIP